MRRRHNPTDHPAPSDAAMRDPESGDEDEPLVGGGTNIVKNRSHKSQGKNKQSSTSFNTRRRLITIGGCGSIILFTIFIFITKNGT